jgi:hypothetical protein
VFWEKIVADRLELIEEQQKEIESLKRLGKPAVDFLCDCVYFGFKERGV